MVTGHTGFKGSWLLMLLNHLGAQVFGYALNPDTPYSLFLQAELSKHCSHNIANVQDATQLHEYVGSVQPEVVLHLAAQSLVRRSYSDPLETWRTNVLGATNLLNSLRQLHHRCAVVIVTTDKVYENQEWHYAYRENDPLGGHDPYSSSKAAAELAVASWRRSFFSSESTIRVSSARAGNVIGGGDWSEDRIVPDMIRHLEKGAPIPVRNPNAMRPWQHVLEPLFGYLILAERLCNNDDPEIQSAFNFGPESKTVRTVRELVVEGLKHWPGRWDNQVPANAPHEAELLKLTNDKARSMLDWNPSYSFEQAVRHTIAWYHRHHMGESALNLMEEQIQDFLNEYE